jgi:hypothetical protein
MTDPEITIIEKDMALTREDFQRGLNRLTDGLGLDLHGSTENHHGFSLGDGQVTLIIETLPERRIGMIVLPRTRVTMNFVNVGSKDRSGFIAAFERRFQRGGG